jgi:hypothetical protein
MTTLAASISLLALAAGSAQAATAQEVVDALLASINPDGDMEITYDGPEESGDDIILTNFHGVSKSDGAELDAATVTIVSGDINAAGELEAASVLVEGIEATSDDGVVTAANVAIVNLVLDTNADPAAQTADNPAARFDSASLSDMAFAEDGTTVATVASAALANSDFNGMIPRSAELALTNVAIDFKSDPENAEAAAQLQALGYEELVFDVAFTAGWDEPNGQFAIDNLDLDIQDMGILSLSLTIGGFTSDVVAQLNSEAGPNQDVLQKLMLEDLAITFEDASLTGRILDMQGEAQGISGAQFAQQISAMLPLVLGQLQNPAFQTEVANAVSAFLGAPGSLSIVAAPAQPIDFLTIAGVASTAPQTLPDMLDISVTANQ